MKDAADVSREDDVYPPLIGQEDDWLVPQRRTSGVGGCIHRVTVTQFFTIVDFCRHLVDKTFRNVCHCSVLFCSLAILDPRVGHTMDVLLHSP